MNPILHLWLKISPVAKQASKSKPLSYHHKQNAIYQLGPRDSSETMNRMHKPYQSRRIARCRGSENKIITRTRSGVTQSRAIFPLSVSWLWHQATWLALHIVHYSHCTEERKATLQPPLLLSIKSVIERLRGQVAHRGGTCAASTRSKMHTCTLYDCVHYHPIICNASRAMQGREKNNTDINNHANLNHFMSHKIFFDCTISFVMYFYIFHVISKYCILASVCITCF